MQKTPMYKRCLWLMVALMMFALPALASAEDYLVVKGGSLNLRKEASTSSAVLGQYPTGTWMTVLSAGTEWTKVKVGGNVGYVMSKYLTATNSSSAMFIRTNTGKNLNMRTAPSLEGSIISSYANGSKVSVLTRGIGWNKVAINGATGYMDNRYLSTSTGSNTETSGYPKTGVVNNPGAKQVLLLRDAPSTDASVIGYYGNGVAVTLLGTSGNFYKVTVDGRNGYMMKNYIKVVSSSSPSTQFPPVPFSAELKNPNGGSVVNFRTGSSLNASIIQAHPVGTGVVVLEVSTDWCKVAINGVEGYISSYFLKVI